MPEEQSPADIQTQGVEAMREALRMMRRLPGVHTRDNEQPVVEQMQRAVALIGKLRELADAAIQDVEDLDQKLDKATFELEIEVPLRKELVQKVYDMERRLITPRELITYVKDRWDEHE